MARISVAATVVVVLAVAATGRDGGRTPGVEGAALNVTTVMVWTGLVAFVLVVSVAVVRAHRTAARRRDTVRTPDEIVSP